MHSSSSMTKRVRTTRFPLRTDPVAHVNDDCVGCGVCGEVAHAARLCPSFAQIDVIQNPNAWDRLQRGVSAALICLFGGARETQTEAVATEP